MIKSIKNIFGLKSEFERLKWNDLRVIRTAWTVEDMNEAIEMGFTLHFVDYVQNPKIHSKLMLLKDAVTGKFKTTSDFRMKNNGDVLVKFYHYYPLKTTLPFAAYILPSDAQAGEYFVISHVIEDLVEGHWNQGDVLPLVMCKAKWTGDKFIYDYDPKDTKKTFIG